MLIKLEVRKMNPKKPKTFTCGKCKKEFAKVKNLQPVPTINLGGICQYCWCVITWGEKWADECRAKDPRMNPVSL